jgi:hypothetical protein
VGECEAVIWPDTGEIASSSRAQIKSWYFINFLTYAIDQARYNCKNYAKHFSFVFNQLTSKIEAKSATRRGRLGELPQGVT